MLGNMGIGSTGTGTGKELQRDFLVDEIMWFVSKFIVAET
jgi:hypothetical protein